MGTRADFYIGRGEQAEWLGSIAWDGYPDGITPLLAEQVPQWAGGPLKHKDAAWPDRASLFEATTEAEYRERLERFFEYRDDVTRPADGWPWPWDDSRTTDYAYAFESGEVWVSSFGHEWHRAAGYDETAHEDDEDGPRTAVFPDMTAIKNVTFGDRSGGMVFQGPSAERSGGKQS